MRRLASYLVLMLFVIVISCSTSGPGVFTKRSPHEQYGKKINDAGLQSTALGRSWFEAAERGLRKPMPVPVPYKETGYFASDRPESVGLRLQVKQGEKLAINLQKKPVIGFRVYMDLWERDEKDSIKTKFIASADSVTNLIEHEVEKSGLLVLRIQPELLQSGEYTVSISAGPSLAYPLKASGKNHTQSFWGDTRDAGARRHEGIDMFAPKRTPAIAAANGVVTRVNENRLGGKVVWMRPTDKSYTLYYAHLDSQIVRDGDRVKIGDTIGLVGNTGNAINTPAHLHFGIYGFGGAIDPFPFVNPLLRIPAEIESETGLIGKAARLSVKTGTLLSGPDGKSASIAKMDRNTYFLVDAATSGWYKVKFPDGNLGFINSKSVEPLNVFKSIQLKTDHSLFETPDSLAASKTILPKGTDVQLLASYNQYQYVRTGGQLEGWIRL